MRADAQPQSAPLTSPKVKRPDPGGDQHDTEGSGRSVEWPGTSGRRRQPTTRAATPTGRLTRNTQRQLAATSRPPTTGPTAAARPPTAVQARTAPDPAPGILVGGEHQTQRGGGQQGGAGRLDHPEADQHSDAGRGRTGHRGGGEHRHTQQEGSVPSVTVGEATEEHQQRRVHDGVGVEHPRQLPQVRGVQVPGDLGQRHVDDEQVQAGQHHPGAHDQQHPRRRGLGPPGRRLGTSHST